MAAMSFVETTVVFKFYHFKKNVAQPVSIPGICMRLVLKQLVMCFCTKWQKNQTARQMFWKLSARCKFWGYRLAESVT